MAFQRALGSVWLHIKPHAPFALWEIAMGGLWRKYAESDLANDLIIFGALIGLALWGLRLLWLWAQSENHAGPRSWLFGLASGVTPLAGLFFFAVSFSPAPTKETPTPFFIQRLESGGVSIHAVNPVGVSIITGRYAVTNRLADRPVTIDIHATIEARDGNRGRSVADGNDLVGRRVGRDILRGLNYGPPFLLSPVELGPNASKSGRLSVVFPPFLRRNWADDFSLKFVFTDRASGKTQSDQLMEFLSGQRKAPKP